MKYRHQFYANNNSPNATYKFQLPTAATAAKTRVTLSQVTVSTNSETPIKVMVHDIWTSTGFQHFVTGQLDWHGSKQLGWDPDNEPSGKDFAIEVENLPFGKHCFVEVEYSKE